MFAPDVGGHGPRHPQAHETAPATAAGPAHAPAPAAPAAPGQTPHVPPAPDGGGNQALTKLRSAWEVVAGFGTDVGNWVADGVNDIRKSIGRAWEHGQKVAAAEASRDQLEKRIKSLGENVSADQRQRILARTRGLSGDALIQEMAVLENALSGHNADRALATYADLDKMASESKKSRERLTPEIIGELVTGVANSRTDSDRGQEGILGARQARESAQALIDMSSDDYASTQRLLDQAGRGPDGKLAPGADVAAEQALILKAVAARRDALKEDVEAKVDAVSGGQTANQRANRELEQFARDIRGMKRDELIQSTTLIDVDDRNTSTTDPNSNRGGDTKSDNDGLFQRFTTTCGPTTAQMVRGEADPAYALRLRQNHFNDNDPTSEYAQEQKRVLEANGGVAVSRLGDNERKSLNTTLEDLRTSKKLSNADYLEVQKLLNGATSGPRSKATQDALAHLRAKNDGHPTDAEIAAMQNDAGKSDAGMGLPPALDTIAGTQTHITYQHNGTSGGTGGGPTDAELKNVDTLVRDGQDVPIRIGYTGGGGHFMMVSDVRGEAGKDRRYLVSDPWTGATRWVSEGDFKSGAFTNSTFDLGTAGVTHLYGDTSQTF